MCGFVVGGSQILELVHKILTRVKKYGVGGVSGLSPESFGVDKKRRGWYGSEVFV